MHPDCNTKSCYACGEIKPLSEFHKDRNQKDGHCNRCIVCTAAYNRERYRRSRDEILAQSARWKRENPDKANAITARWREANRDYFVQYRAEKRAERLAYNKRYYRKNREARLKYGRQYHRENREASAAKTRRYRARKRRAKGDHTGEQFRELVKHYGPNCLCCGKRRKLTADHVVALNNGGSNDIGNIQPLCGRCNSAKGDFHHTDYRPDKGAFARALMEKE